MNITAEQPTLFPHTSFLEDRGYKSLQGSIRYFAKGSVFVSFNKKLTKCVILRKHPLRPEVISQHHPMNVCYRGRNPFTDLTFAAALWENLGLNFKYEEKEAYGQETDDLDVLTEF